MSSSFSKNSLEWQLEQRYINDLIQIGLLERATAKEDFDSFVEEAKNDTTPPEWGDKIFQIAGQDETFKTRIEFLRSEGISDDDIRAWHNMHPIQRSCIGGILKFLHMTMFIDGLKKQEPNAASLNPDEAINRSAANVTVEIVKRLPRYGDHEDEEWRRRVGYRLTENDRVLPFESHFQVERFLAKHTPDPQFEARIRQATSLNALVREEVKNGGIEKSDSSTRSQVTQYGYLKNTVFDLITLQEDCLTSYVPLVVRLILRQFPGGVNGRIHRGRVRAVR